HQVSVDDRTYHLDFLITGAAQRVAIELDGFAYHSSRSAFIYDRVRQNDLIALGFTVLRFSHGAIRDDTFRCVSAHLSRPIRNSVERTHWDLVGVAPRTPSKPRECAGHRLGAVSCPGPDRSRDTALSDLRAEIESTSPTGRAELVDLLKT